MLQDAQTSLKRFIFKDIILYGDEIRKPADVSLMWLRELLAGSPRFSARLQVLGVRSQME